MYVINPTPITDANFVSSTVPESATAAWASGTTYAAGDRVSVAANHTLYQSLQASNTGHDPATATAWWVAVQPTERWAMFDGAISTETAATGTISVVLAPGITDAVALVGMTGISSATVTMTDDGATVFTATEDLSGSIPDWAAYFFDPIVFRSFAIVSNLPAYLSGIVTVTLTGSSAISIGALVVGRSVQIGDVSYGAKVGIIDYSKKTVDDWGNTVVSKRAFSKTSDLTVYIPRARLDYLIAVLSDLRSTPAVWVGHENIESLLIFGFFRSFDVQIAYPTISLCTIQIEGLT